MIPESSRSSVVLPEPLRPTRPTASPGSTASETSAERPDVRRRAARPRATNEVLQRARLLAGRRGSCRVACSTTIAPGFTPLDGTREAPAGTSAGEHAHERGIGVRHLDPLEARARAPARAPSPRRRGPSGSRGGRRRSRPGRRGRARRRAPCSASRWSRMSGPSHGSPVGDSLWNENDQSSSARALARRAGAVSSSWSLYGSPSSRIRAGRRVRGEDDVRVGAADAVGEQLDEARARRASSRRSAAPRGRRAPASSWSR